MILSYCGFKGVFNAPKVDNLFFMGGKSQVVRKTKVPDTFDYSKSTTDIYGTDLAVYSGPFRSLREKLDYSYHRNYVEKRQIVQDRIIEWLLNGGDQNMAWTTQEICSKECQSSTRNQWVVFTAGPMGKY